MAQIKTRKRANGTTAHTVSWRLGGTREGKWQQETFDGERAARDFRRDVEVADHEWPTGYLKGVGYVELARREELTIPMFAAYATTFVRELTDIGPDTRQRYFTQVTQMAKEFTGIVGRPPTVAEITDSHVRLWINDRADAGAKPKTIANYHGLLYSVMHQATRKKLREDNPCAESKLPRRDVDIDTDDDKVFLTEDEWRLVHAAVPAHYQDFATVAVGTGLRFGELTALKVRDLDLDAPVPRLSVRRAWKRNGTGEHARPGLGRFYLGKPKTKKARRRITLAPAVVEILRRAAKGKGQDDLVFVAQQGGRIDQSKFYEYQWLPAIKKAIKAGLRVQPRFHDLRHTHAAWLISANVPLPVIQQRLGHESIVTTIDTYGGLLEQAHEIADAAIEAALTGGRIGKPRLVTTEVQAADDNVTYDADDDVVDDDMPDALSA